MDQPPPALTELGSIYRIMDANANRASEGLRVVEEYLRFHCDDGFLSRTCKQLRHDLAETLLLFDCEARRRACRSSSTDVGATSQTDAEYVRLSLIDVAIANVSRVAEALRTLEEYAKTLSVASAKEFETLRYRVYSLGKAIGHRSRGNRLLADKLLYALIDLRFGIDDAFLNRVNSLLDGGVDIVQLRDKRASDQQIIAAARLLKQLTSQVDTLLIVNDRPDIARVVHADGVHVGQEEMSVADARSIVGPDLLVGVSTHDLQQARQAVLDGADYLGVGPVFASQTKDFESFVGLEMIGEVTGEIGIPVFAIGGMLLDRVDDVTRHGGTRIAVGHALWHAPDPGRVASEFKSKLVAPQATAP